MTRIKQIEGLDSLASKANGGLSGFGVSMSSIVYAQTGANNEGPDCSLFADKQF